MIIIFCLRAIIQFQAFLLKAKDLQLYNFKYSYLILIICKQFYSVQKSMHTMY